MAAVTLSLVGQLKAGDHVVASKALFGSCRYIVEDYLPRYGVASTLVDGTDLDQWRDAVRPKPEHLSWRRRPTTLEVIDIAEVAQIAHEADATLVVDNVFATPIYQSPLALGADCVVYSATKHIDGQGRCLGGIILASEDFIQKHVHTLLRQTGPSLSPFNAWVLSEVSRPCRYGCGGKPTLQRRSRSRCRTPEDHTADLSRPARPSAGQDRAEQMRGGSTLVAFDIAGGKKAAFRFRMHSSSSASATISATPRA